ncbi:MAG: dynamin family protein [Caldilineales bacterium]|nr:dynamin family protein [Caldilineales bacterium]
MQKVLTPKQQEVLQRERTLFATLEVIAAQVEASANERELLARTRQTLDDFFLLVVVGEFNSGKSAFVNALLGQRFLDEGVTPTTSQIHILGYGPQPEAVQVEPFVLNVSYPVDWLQETHIVDTPGTNAIIQRHQEITEAFVPRSDLVLFVTSADRPFSESERTFLELVRGWGKKVVVVVNKIDILEDEKALGEILEFVKTQAVAVLGMTPQVFPVSVKQAQLGKNSSDPAEKERLLQLSRFPELETFILHTLDQQQRLQLKLESPLGVAERLSRAYQTNVSARLDLLQDDFQTLESIDAQLDAYAPDMRHDFRFRLTKIDNILHDLRLRGDRFFEDTIRIGRIFDLINGSKLQAEFEREVVADTHEQIGAEVSSLIDWMVARNYKQWQEVTGYLNRRAAQYGDRIVGNVGGEFEINRQELLQSVGRAAREVVASYDQRAEARKQSESIKTSLAAMGAVEVGAIGLAAILLHVLTRALDPLGIIAAGTLAIAGLFILPARRRSAKADLDAKVEDLRQRLDDTLTTQFERELEQAIQDIREAIAPYSRFIRTEHNRLTELNRQLDAIAIDIKDIRSKLHAQTVA